MTKLGRVTVGTLAALCAVMGTAAEAQTLKPMTFSLNVPASGTHVGFLYAKSLGLFKDAGLDVTFQEGKGSATTAQIVATGQVDLAMADGLTVMQLHARGAPVVVIAPVLQTNAYGIISLADRNLTTPESLKGKTLGVDPGTAMAALLDGVLSAVKLTRSDVTIVNLPISSMVPTLLEKKVDAIVAGTDVEGIRVADNAKSTNILFGSVGMPSLGISVFGRADKMAADPDKVKSFLKAGFEGWRRARLDPEAAAAAVSAMYPAVTKEAILKQFNVDAKLLCLPGSKTMGRLPPQLWDENYKIMTTYLQVPKDKPVSDYYTEAYLPAEMPTCP